MKNIRDISEEVSKTTSDCGHDKLQFAHEIIKEDIQKDKQVVKESTEAAKIELFNEGNRLKDEDINTVLKRLFSLKSDVADNDVIEERILSGAKFTGTNMCLLILAIFIASVGLNTGSTAVIIGAMLLSPLMGSILEMAYSTVSLNGKNVVIYGTTFMIQILISVCTATVYFLLSPIKEPTAEIIARTQPSFYDVIIALCGGLAGIIGQTRSDKANNIIPGVAIATALMPPLCTCGYAIAN